MNNYQPLTMNDLAWEKFSTRYTGYPSVVVTSSSLRPVSFPVASFEFSPTPTAIQQSSSTFSDDQLLWIAGGIVIVVAAYYVYQHINNQRQAFQPAINQDVEEDVPSAPTVRVMPAFRNPDQENMPE